MFLGICFKFRCTEIMIKWLSFIDIREDKFECIEVDFNGGDIVTCKDDLCRYVLTHQLYYHNRISLLVVHKNHLSLVERSVYL